MYLRPQFVDGANIYNYVLLPSWIFTCELLAWIASIRYIPWRTKLWLVFPLKATRKANCVGLCVLKEVLVVTMVVPISQKKSEKLYPIVVLNHWRDSLIFIRTGLRPIQEVVVLVLKCALAITAVMAIYCRAIVCMDRLSDWFHIGEVTVVK